MAAPQPRAASSARAEPVELRLDGIAHGGEAVGRLPDGKACFVAYAIPGERVLVQIVEERRRWARGRLLRVIEPAPERVEPPCPYFGPTRCGGCRLQHIHPDRQSALKQRIVSEQLERIGGIAHAPVSDTVRLDDLGYRREARFAVDEQGRLGFRRASSHDVIAVDRCALLTPAAQALRDAAGDEWQGAEQVVLRTGAGADDAAIVVHPGPGALPPLPPVDAAAAVVDSRGEALALRGDPVLVERVGGFEFRISPTSFFQPSRQGAEALLALVRAEAQARPGDAALDLCAGVGLFARGLSADGAQVVAVEASPAACADARANLAGCQPPARVEQEDAAAFARAMAAADDRADIVVIDPPRRGAGVELSRDLTLLNARRIVYVSCDPAALARDARALTAAGYGLERAIPVDQFAHTAAIETVATFAPG